MSPDSDIASPSLSNLLSLATIAAIVGPLAYVIVTLLHPGGDGNDHPMIFRHYAASQSWIAIHLAQLLAMVMGLLGLAGLAASMFRLQERGRVFALLAIAFAVASIALAAVLQAVDGIALKRAVDAWLVDGGNIGTPSFAVARGIRWTEEGVNAMLGFTMAATVIFACAAILRGAIYPSWLAWSGAAIGLGVIIGSIVIADTGFSPLAQTWVLARNPGLWLWTAVAGVFIWRRRPT